MVGVGVARRCVTARHTSRVDANILVVGEVKPEILDRPFADATNFVELVERLEGAELLAKSYDALGDALADAGAIELADAGGIDRQSAVPKLDERLELL